MEGPGVGTEAWGGRRPTGTPAGCGTVCVSAAPQASEKADGFKRELGAHLRNISI